MATTPYLSSINPGGGVTGNPGYLNTGDSIPGPLLLTHQGGLVVANIQGKHATSRMRGNGFCATSGAGGVSIVAAGATTGSMTMYNPLTSGVYASLERITFAAATTVADVISGLGLEGSVQVVTGTSATISKFPLGAAKGSPQCSVFKGATIVAMTDICDLGINVQATTYGPNPAIVDLDGLIVLAPGFSVNLFSAITQSTNIMQVSFHWTEWLV